MIGSPASRGAFASVTGAGRGCFASAPVASAASAAIIASIETTGPAHPRMSLCQCVPRIPTLPPPSKCPLCPYIDDLRAASNLPLGSQATAGLTHQRADALGLRRQGHVRPRQRGVTGRLRSDDGADGYVNASLRRNVGL